MLPDFETGINYVFDDDEKMLTNSLPFNPLKNANHRKQLEDTDCGVQFSHTLEDQIGGQLEAGFLLTHILEDTNDECTLKEHNIPSFIMTRAVKLKEVVPCRVI